MAVPFGFSVGDFIAVGRLIAQVIDEVRENGEATSSYHSVLVELEALQRALRQLQRIKPARDELLQLTSIRATVCACQRPLEDFLSKIAKFERRLGAFNAGDQRWKGLPRRVQFRVMFKDDIKELRCFLASHIATINILLMTQAVSSISLAGKERHEVASGLESKILANRRLLNNISDNVDVSLRQQRHIQNHLLQQRSALEDLENKSDVIHAQVQHQAIATEAVHTTAEHIQSQTRSVLGATTQILAFITSGIVRIQHISEQLNRMLQICTSFTTEMRAAMLRILRLFSEIHSMLQRIERSLPSRPQLPIIQFTTALGETLALPYQLCQQWTTFTELLKVIFHDKPGANRVLSGMYHIMDAHHRRTITEYDWQDVVAQDEHLSMSFIMDDLTTSPDLCPFPTCRASIADAQDECGGRICNRCKRWSKGQTFQQHILSVQTGQSDTSGYTEPGLRRDELACHGRPTENMEIYRYIHVFCLPDDIFEDIQEEPAIAGTAHENKAPGVREAVPAYRMPWSIMEKWLMNRYPGSSDFNPQLSHDRWTFDIPESLSMVDRNELMSLAHIEDDTVTKHSATAHVGPSRIPRKSRATPSSPELQRVKWS